MEHSQNFGLATGKLHFFFNVYDHFFTCFFIFKETNLVFGLNLILHSLLLQWKRYKKIINIVFNWVNLRIS